MDSNTPDTAEAPETVAGCPCGTMKSYDVCCGRLHRGAAKAFTAEQLMRSRYTAFAVGDETYLLRSWHSSTRPRRMGLDPTVQWTRLEIVATTAGGVFDQTGTVEFVAHHFQSGRRATLRERSEFVREDRLWVYLAGVNPTA